MIIEFSLLKIKYVRYLLLTISARFMQFNTLKSLNYLFSFCCLFSFNIDIEVLSCMFIELLNHKFSNLNVLRF